MRAGLVVAFLTMLWSPLSSDAQPNRRTARTLGLTVPPAVLLQADHVIE